MSLGFIPYRIRAINEIARKGFCVAPSRHAVHFAALHRAYRRRQHHPIAAFTKPKAAMAEGRETGELPFRIFSGEPVSPPPGFPVGAHFNQYSSGSRNVVTLRSPSVMIQRVLSPKPLQGFAGSIG